MPTSTDTVIVEGDADTTVTLSGQGSAASVKIIDESTLALANGKLAATQGVLIEDGRLEARSGSNTVSVVNNHFGLMSVASNAMLAIGSYNSHRDGDALIANNATLKITTEVAKITNRGDIALSSTGDATRLLFAASGEFTSILDRDSDDYAYQGGTITMSDSASNLIASLSPDQDHVIVNVNNIIRGAGKLGDGKVDILNLGAQGDGSQSGDHAQGVIRATRTNHALEIEIAGDNHLQNFGLIEGAGKAGLRIFSATHGEGINTGIIQANAGSQVSLQNIEMTNRAGGIIQANAGGRVSLDNVLLGNGQGGHFRTTGAGAALDLKNVNLVGGEVAIATGSSLNVAQQVVIDGATIINAGDINIGALGNLRLKDSLGIGGNINVAGAGTLSLGAGLGVDGHVVVNGTIAGANATLTNNNGQISGTGQINVKELDNAAGGKIFGSLRLNGAINNFGSIQGARINGAVLNEGTISFSTILDGSSILSQDGTGIIASSSLGNLNVKRGTISATGAGQVSFAGTSFQEGTLASSGFGSIKVLASSNATSLYDTRIAKGTSIAINNGATLTIDYEQDTRVRVLDNVSIALGGTSQPTTLKLGAIGADLPYVLRGGSKITLSDSSSNNVYLTDVATLKMEEGIISGAGDITTSAAKNVSDHILLDIGVGGTVRADGRNTLTLNLDSIRSDGVLEAKGGKLEIITPNVIEGDGAVRVSDGGTVDMFRAKSFLGDFQYRGTGTILGPQEAPDRAISGFFMGDTYVFGEKTDIRGHLDTTWLQYSDNTGKLTLSYSSGQAIYATLQFSGVYTGFDFAANAASFADGYHVTVSYVGTTLSWLEPTDGSWHTAANWGPTGLYVPGADNDVLITVDGEPYAVTVSQDTKVKSVATGASARLNIEAGSKLTTTAGTSSVANAGVVRVRDSASFVVGGGIFEQTASGRIVSQGDDTRIVLGEGAGIRGGLLSVGSGSSLSAAGTATLENVDIVNDGTLRLANKAQLFLSDGAVNGNGSIVVDDRSVLGLVRSIVVNNDITLTGGADLAIGGSVFMRSPVTLNQGSQITSDGMGATLTSGGTIQGTGKIGDDGLTLINRGTIRTGASGVPAGRIDIGTGANTIVSSGLIAALNGGSVNVASTLRNTGDVVAAVGGTARLAGSVVNSGEMTARGQGSVLDLAGAVTNAKTISAENGGSVEVAGAITQKPDGVLIASGVGSTIDLASGASVSGGMLRVNRGAEAHATEGGQVAVRNAAVSIGAASELRVENTSLGLFGTRVTNAGLFEANATPGSPLLLLANSTLAGRGTYDLAGGLIQVAGSSAVDKTHVKLDQGTRLVGSGAAATLTNGGYIEGDGATIGDGNLTLINNGTITAEIGGRNITIDTGANAVVNNGTITGKDAGSKVTIGGLLHNSETGKLLSGAGEVIASRVENAGFVHAQGQGHIAIEDSLVSSGRVRVDQGASLEAAETTNSGVALAVGSGSSLTLGNGDKVVTNSGHIRAIGGGTVTLDHGVANLPGGELVVKDGGQMDVLGAATAGHATLYSHDSSLFLQGSASAETTTKVVFANGKRGGDAHLVLDNSDLFSGTVAGFRQGDTIDVTDVAFVAGMSSYDVGMGLLNLSDGTNSAQIQLLGQYAASQFAFESNGFGGMLVTVADPAVAATTTMLAAHA